MATSQLSIEMLPALHGDSLWVEWGDDGDRRRLLIDGGPRHTFDLLSERFQQMATDQRRVELMMISHIDLDHIDGAIKLLRTTELDIDYGDVWFNDYHHLAPEPEGQTTRGGKQGEYLGAVLEDVDLPWNVAFGGGPIVVPPSGSLPRVKFDGGLELVLVSPNQKKLTALQKTWKRTLDKAGMNPGDRADALARLDQGMKRADVSRGGRSRFGHDSSKPNGSSIAVIAEYRGERWLLAGDAHTDVLVESLTRYGAEVGEPRLRLDGFKIPHHGSTNNMSIELLQLINCRRFLISTNGNIFKHPDHDCIELIINQTERPHLVFNYLSPFTERWQELSDRYTAEYLDSPGSGNRENTSGGRTMTDGRDQPQADDERSVGDIAHEDEPQITALDADSPAGYESTSRAGEAASVAVQITVHHASLETADYPVLVGHYIATPLSGAEGFIDRRFKQRLSERIGQGHYPGPVGTSLLVTGPRRRPPVAGALVVGLGEYGDLSPLLLVETVRAALVDHALDEANRRDDDNLIQLGISTVLLGATGDQGISVAGSVRAMVDGVRQANRSLRSGDSQCRAQYNHLQIVERNAPESELAYLALDKIPGSETKDEDEQQILPPTELLLGEGRLTNSLPVDTSEASWWRIRVTDVTPEPDDGQPAPYLELEYAVGGRLARVGNVIHRVERRRLERLLAGSVGDPSTSANLRTTLFELLFPNELKWDLTGAQDVQLEVDDRTADIPWEMLEARNPHGENRSELALRAKLVRQFKLPSIPTVRRAATPRALVIGNPPTGNLAPTLPGAAAEATAVVKKLAAGGPGPSRYEVESHIYNENQWADPAIITEIETALLAHDYRIIHIAGHGFFQPDEETRTGVAIGPDDFITAQMLKQLNVTPDVVFLNCCHIGQVGSGLDSGAIDFTKRNYNRLSASLSRQLIDSGVRAVVVAGWAVSDAGAKAFAEEFYTMLLAGIDFSTAVRNARLAASKDGSSTWGAYQCYGDGSYRLPEESAPEPSEPSAPRTLREVLRRLESLVSGMESVGVDDPSGSHHARAVKELDALEQTAEEKGWTTTKAGNLCEQFAQSWGAIGDFEKAIEWYEKALRQDDGEMTFRGLEFMANLEDRLAASLIREHRETSKETPPRAKELMASSSRRLAQLEAVTGTSQRRALQAGAQKRRAVATDGEAREEALTQSISSYLDSYKELKEPYTLFNYVQLEEIRSRRKGDESAATSQRATIDAELAAQTETMSSESDYWSAIAIADGKLTVAIAEDAVDTGLDQLAETYRRAFDSRSTARQRASTIEHIEDLAQLHPDPDQARALEALQAELLKSGLEDEQAS